MESFEGRYYLAEASSGRRLLRDARMVLDSLRFLLLWATVGWRLRRAVRRAQRDATQLVLEDLLQLPERK